MTAMATSTHVRTQANGARRAELPEAAAMRHTRRIKMAAACYLGLVVLVGVFVLAAQVLPPGVGLPLFVLGAGAVVALGHPRIREVAHRR